MDELIFAGLVPCHQSTLETLRLSEITPHLHIAIDTVMSFRHVISISPVILFSGIPYLCYFASSTKKII